MYRFTLSIDAINLDNVNVSDSENGFGPAKVSEHGFDDAPASEMKIAHEKFY